MNKDLPLKGMTLTRIERKGNKSLTFHTTDGRVFKMHHNQDCCETVEIDSIVGDLDDLVGHPLLLAEEVSNKEVEVLKLIGQLTREDSAFYTWTFYKLATIKGYVDIRWYGSSNGFYSESVDFEEITI